MSTPNTGAGDREWQKFAAYFGSQNEAIAIYTTPILLVGESARAYDTGAFSLAAVGCRAAIESAGHVAMTHTPIFDTAWKLNPPSKDSGKFDRLGIGEILEWLKANSVLPSERFANWERIKADGDFIAHLASRQMQEHYEWVTGPPERATKPLRSWVTPDEAIADLRDACGIVKEIMEWSRAQRTAPGT